MLLITDLRGGIFLKFPMNSRVRRLSHLFWLHLELSDVIMRHLKIYFHFSIACRMCHLWKWCVSVWYTNPWADVWQSKQAVTKISTGIAPISAPWRRIFGLSLNHVSKIKCKHVFSIVELCIGITYIHITVDCPRRGARFWGDFTRSRLYAIFTFSAKQSRSPVVRLKARWQLISQVGNLRLQCLNSQNL